MEKNNQFAAYQKKPTGNQCNLSRQGTLVDENKLVLSDDEYYKLPPLFDEASENEPLTVLKKVAITNSTPYRARFVSPKDDCYFGEQQLEKNKNPFCQDDQVRPTSRAQKEKTNVFVVRSTSSPPHFQTLRDKDARPESTVDDFNTRPNSADYVTKFVPLEDSENEVDAPPEPAELQAGCRKKKKKYRKKPKTHQKKAEPNRSDSDQIDNISKPKAAWAEETTNPGKNKISTLDFLECKYDSDDTQYGIPSLPDQDESSPDGSISLDFDLTSTAMARMATLEKLGEDILSNSSLANLARDNINASVLVGNIYPPDALAEEVQGTWAINDLLHSLIILGSMTPDIKINTRYFKK